jgi:hypothetical protein
VKHDWWDAEPMRQEAPYPQALADLVDSLSYRDGWPGQSWRFSLLHVDRGQGSAGLTLCIRITGPNAYHPEELPISVMHYMIVPAAAYDERSWRRWLFEQVGLVELHERMEAFLIDGERPYAPSHGPGSDPYLVRELGTDLDRRTSFRGDVKPEATP